MSKPDIGPHFIEYLKAKLIFSAIPGYIDGRLCGGKVTMWLAEVTSLKANGLLGPYKMLLLLLLPILVWPKKILLSSGF